MTEVLTVASACRGCGAPILWIKTGGGKSMPCDPEQITYWEKPKAKEKVVTPNGMVISCELDGDPQAATGVGYRPHWATCPKADQFKGRRG